MTRDDALRLLLSDEVYAAMISQRFTHEVDSSGGPDACWPARRKARWSYGVMAMGVGRGKGRGSPYRRLPVCLTHRVSYVLHHREMPQGGLVLHHCDNPPCSNPAHLFAGTDADNVRDKVAKGRGVIPPTSAPGEVHGNAKHANSDALAVATLFREGWRNEDIAAKLCLSRRFVSHVTTGWHWSAITGLPRIVTFRAPPPSPEDAAAMAALRELGMTWDEIASRFKIGRSTVRRAVARVVGRKMAA